MFYIFMSLVRMVAVNWNDDYLYCTSILKISSLRVIKYFTAMNDIIVSQQLQL